MSTNAHPDIIATGFAISDPEMDHFEMIGLDGEYLGSFGICKLVADAGGEVVPWSERTAFRYEGDGDSESWALEREEYRKRTGKNRPVPIRVRITVEVLP